MKDLLIGAISGNYSVEDIATWVKTSTFNNVERVLLLYNSTNSTLEAYLKDQGVVVVHPHFDFWGQEITSYGTNTGTVSLDNSYNLVHNIRFFHIWNFLSANEYSRVLITDVKDVCFNSNPFDVIAYESLVATSEEVRYSNEDWNREHLHYNLGIIGLDTLLDKPVYNVGVFGGDYKYVKDMCADIYLLSCGKYKVADQTSFNYLIHTKYKDIVTYTGLKDKLAVHLHVINAGLVEFNLHTIKDYPIVHQYDRLGNDLQHYYTIPE